jgi:hypothetical protein
VTRAPLELQTGGAEGDEGLDREGGRGRMVEGCPEVGREAVLSCTATLFPHTMSILPLHKYSLWQEQYI